MRYTKLAAAGLCALGLAGCASGPYYGDSRAPVYRGGNGATYGTEYGRVVGIETVAVNGNGNGHTTGAGAVIGGVVGGVIGHQVGSGRGNDVATVAGAIGGAVVGNEIERNRNAGSGYAGNAYRVDVRVEGGAVRTVMMENVGEIRVGDRVRIDGDRISRY